MAPLKFEDQLKEKLEQRTLLPSKHSWATLSKRLDAEDKTQKTPWFLWLGVAASVVLLVAVSVLYFNKTQTKINPIVKQNTDSIKTTIKTNPKTTKQTQSLNLNKKEAIVTISKEKIQQPKKTIKQKNSVPKPNKTQNVMVNAIVINDVKPIENEIIIKDSVTKALSTFKTKEAMANNEADSLLKLASKKLLMDKALKHQSHVVDANTLLLEAEEDLGQSFRTKVYNALKNSYKTIKTAVAERKN